MSELAGYTVVLSLKSHDFLPSNSPVLQEQMQNMDSQIVNFDCKRRCNFSRLNSRTTPAFRFSSLP